MNKDQLYEILIQVVEEKNISADIKAEYKLLDKEYEPDYIVYAQSTEEISELVKLANEYKFALYPIGSGGNFTRAIAGFKGGVILSTKYLNKVRDYRTHNLSIEVEAGITNLQLQKYLENDKLFFPIDTYGESTIGGQIASNRYGENKYMYKSTRFYVLGLEFVCPRGKINQVGGSTSKNMSGYDLSQLLAGSWGNFGIITKAILKIQPKIRKKQVLHFNSYDLEEITKTVTQLLREEINLAFLKLYLEESRYYLIVELEGCPYTIKYQAQFLRLKYELYQSTEYIQKPEKYKGLISLSLENVMEGIQTLEGLATKYQKNLKLTGNLTNGVLEFEIDKNPERYLQNLTKVLKPLDGTLLYEKKVWIRASKGEAYYHLLNTIKEQVDPNSVLLAQSIALRE